jgi:superfamily II DNA/RNA helicase
MAYCPHFYVVRISIDSRFSTASGLSQEFIKLRRSNTVVVRSASHQKVGKKQAENENESGDEHDDLDEVNDEDEDNIADSDEQEREATLLTLCTRSVHTKAIIFFPHKVTVHRSKIIFSLAGLNAAELHGNLTQAQVSRFP